MSSGRQVPDLRPRFDRAAGAYLLCAAVLATVLAVVLEAALDEPVVDLAFVGLADSSAAGALWTVAYLGGIGFAAEELFFRGVLIQSFRLRLGLVLGWAAHRTGSIWPGLCALNVANVAYFLVARDMLLPV